MLVRGQDDGVHSQLTTVVARLQLKNGQCLHTNSVRVVNVEDQLIFDEPSVLSSLAEQNDNQITRRTVVRYLKKKYIIQDVYQFDYSPGQEQTAQGGSASIQSSCDNLKSEQESPKREISNHANRYKKVCIFHKQTDDGKTFTKRNTKNLPKNFYKGFLAYMESRNKTQNLDETIRVLKNMGKGSKFNNILILKLISSYKMAPYFRQFLQSHAEEWINGSKVSDKGMHLEAVSIYLSLISKYDYAEDANSSLEQ